MARLRVKCLDAYRKQYRAGAMSEETRAASAAAESYCDERRDTQRICRALYVEMRGQRANYPAMFVNVSPWRLRWMLPDGRRLDG